MDEKRIASMMKSLGCTREEAISVIAEDKAIDKMDIKEVLADLTPEQRKAMKAATKTGTKKVTAVKRERKPDEEKAEIVAKIADFLAEIDGFSVEISNKEREIALIVGANNYSVTLTRHRPPKK